MIRLEKGKTVVLALGNRIRSDDAIGLLALQCLERDTRINVTVTMVEGGTKGLELVPYVSGASRLLVLDAVDGGVPPGTVLRMQREDFRSLPGSGSVHELALADILNALRVLDQEPQETVLLGVQPATTELGVSLSPRVQAAMPALVEAGIAELARWGCLESDRAAGKDLAVSNLRD
ncbi:MAG TPA: hydrogenase maturation protease [Candidatus Limnocylindrales bacterium]|nr:hydrogenase maturation protease [Candidatus Limnocylindrales bacterium]